MYWSLLMIIVFFTRCRLLIKSAILLPTAKQDEVNIVQIESEGYNKEKVLFIRVSQKNTFSKKIKSGTHHASVWGLV